MKTRAWNSQKSTNNIKSELLNASLNQIVRVRGPGALHPEAVAFYMFERQLFHWNFSLGSRREAFLSQNISSCMWFHIQSCFPPIKTARYSVIIWPSLWFTGPASDLLCEKQNWPLTIEPIENTDKKSQNCSRGFVYKTFGWFELEAVCKHRPSSWCCNTEVILGIQVSDVTYYQT